jgi:hypothetical protein
MFELTPIAENEVCSWENVTVETGSYAFNALETGAEDNVMWGELEDTVWVGLNVGSAISVEVMGFLGVDVAINEVDVRARRELAVVVNPVKLKWLNVGSATVLAVTRTPVGLG